MAKLELKTKDAQDAVRQLREGVKSLKNELKDTGGAQAMIDKLDKLQKIAELNIHKFKNLDAAIAKSASEAKKAVSPYDKLVTKFKEANKAAKDAAVEFGVYSKQANSARAKTAALSKEINKINSASKPLKSRFAGINNVLGKLAGFVSFYIIAQQALALAKSTFELTKRLNAFNFAMEAVLKNEQELITTRSFLREITESYGAELISTTNRYIKFRTAAKEAGMSMADTQKIFATMTKAAGVLGLQTDELTGIYLALEQMISKGKITTEELRRQLGERLPGAMDIMAKSIGVSTAELDKMMKKGEVISKDVLPRFAEEVERAFGLEAVTKVETLAAAEVRLGNAWTNLINAIESGEGRISKPLMEFFQDLSNVLNQLELINRTDTDWMDVAQADGYAEGINSISKAFEIYKRDFPDKELNIKDVALSNLSDYGKEWQRANEAVKEATDSLNKLPDEQAFEGATLEKIREDREAAALSAKKDLAYWKGKINAAKSFFKVVDENKNIEDDEDGSVVLKSLRDVLDLEKKIQINRIKAQIQANKDLIDNDKTTYNEKINLLKDNAIKAESIAKLEEQLAIESINSKSNKEIESLKKSFEKGKVLKEDFNNQLNDLEKERTQKIQIELQKRNSKTVSAQNNLIDDLTNLNEKYNKEQIELASAPIDKKIALLNEELLAEKTSATRRKAIISEIKKLQIESANAQIRASIMVVEAQLLVAKVMGQNTEAIEHQLDILKGKLKSIPDDIPDEEINEKFRNTLELIQRFSDAIADITLGIHDRNLEMIEAEIQAQEDKYDREIELAEGNALMIKNLEEEKQLKLDELEAKRLKEEQRKAKFEKAKALVDIAINTAVGISAVTREGFLGLAMIPVLVALGALQAAAVVAQPIPQYMDGLESADKDHIGMINDGRKNGKMVKEYVKRDGKILSTNKKDAIVGLKKNDTVYPDYESMVADTFMFNALSNGLQIKENDFDVLGDIIETSLKNGFKGVKVNNNVKLINNQRNNSYGVSLRRWN